MNQPALLLIDMVQEFVHPEGKLFVPGAPETVPRLAALLAAFRQAGRPVVHVVRQHRPDGSDVESVRREVFHRLGGFCLPGSWGAEVAPELAPQPGEPVVVKHGWSAFFQTDLRRQLRRLQVETLVIGGTQTPNCVRATLYEATAYRYDVVLLEDGTSSASPEVQAANLRDLRALGVPLMTCSEVAARLKPAEGPAALLRPVRPEEQEEFTRLALETIREEETRLDAVMRWSVLRWWTERVMHYLYHRRSQAVLLEVGGKVAGFLVLRPAGEALRIEAIGVRPAFRRQGWGGWLLEQAKERARRLGLRRLELEVSPANRPALALYWQEGFRPLPRRRGRLRLEGPPAKEELR